ncbi:TetR family transcriptional regulator [Labedaea rhizosphaerae]|uniref:TetR family transcriptional regulator n=1 Tax=Labedaea rhizosphaerae TaxID=598644 RepID=A0A4R6SAT1_LABRH|nr:TetR family transcriptional regulator [Labedaea rhizosphaerae]TDP97149.1 TetR family transcriptional regulator [Labedaea rhizosphaerae]
MARAGRRPGQTETREAILAAARERFGTHGYDGTTIRAIAADADVNPALVHHFFGSKDKVFAAAMHLPVDPAVMVGTILDGPRSGVGERLVRLFLMLWETPQPRAAFFGLLRSVSTNEQAATMMRQFIQRAVLAKVATELGVPPLRVTGMAAQLFGLALVRYVVKVEPLAGASHDEVVAMIAPVLQGYIGG